MSTSITQFNDLRIPLDEIQKATNNFSEKNIIGKGGFGNVYKGQLLRSGELINISARRLDSRQGQGDVEFWTEVSVLSSLKHPNIVSLIGFCDEKGEKIIINRHEAKGSLGMYLSDPALTWEQRVRISCGAALAIWYLHDEEVRNYSIIHRNINSSTILLDDNFEAKLSGFEFSIKDSVDRMERYISSDIIFTQGYMAPETLKSGDVTQKSDVYSFGVVLCEILCGRKAFIPDESEDNKLLAPLVRFHEENDTLQDIIHPDLWNQINTEVSDFARIACDCTKEDRLERPDMSQILEDLEDLEIHEFKRKKEENDDLEPPSEGESEDTYENDASEGESEDTYENDASEGELEDAHENDVSEGESKDTDKNTSSNAWKVNKFEHLRIGLADILSATKNFSEEYATASPFPYCTYYETKLKCFDREYNFSLEGKNKGELPKRYYHVIIKCINRNDMFYTEDKFYKEIEILGTCMHENIQPLLGFCEQGGHMILAYENIFDSCYLSSYLNSLFLTWEIRLKICLDIAHGLNYIHNEMEDQKMVIHRKISSCAILWDVTRRRAIITEFELSTFFPSDHVVDFKDRIWTDEDRNLAPEFRETGKATKESDIYSFGLVMFEILWGTTYPKLWQDNGNYVAQRWLKKGIIKQKMARAIREENFDNKKFLKKGPNEESLDTFIKITEQCLAVNPEQRPTSQVIIQELEKALLFHKGKLYSEFLHLHIPLPVIVTATSNFAAENLMKEDSSGKYYKGKMLRSGQLTDIVARRLDCIYGQEVKFIGAISIHSSLQHKNIISLIGICNENGEKIIIYEHAAHGILDQHLTDATLTWFRRLQICVGVAHALSHIHYDVIHCDINSSKIFLDKDWEPKLCGFELSTKYPETWRHRLLFSHHSDNLGNIDPVVTPKYDVYSFGVLLFEVLCGRKAMIGDSGVDQPLAEMAKRHFEERKLDEIIVEGLRKQMDLESLTIFSNTAYNCLKERVQRPTMDQVVRDLEEAIMEHQSKRDNIEQSAAADKDLSSIRLKSDKLECLRIPFRNIKSATDSFNKKCCIGSGGYGMVYKADLDHLDIERFSSAMEGKNENELPKRHSTVAIKQILNRQDEEGKQGFLAEIELLTSCKHQNIVSLLGFSSEDREMILVYEFLVNGSLDEYLGSTEKKINLTWNQRLQICLNIAEGLKYLHTSMKGKPRIIHRDIKSANVLLDEKWNAKIADFGLSKFHPANQPASTIQSKGFVGTVVYMDPEYYSKGKYKKESDVYSFGVVLFEILSGTLAYDTVYLAENSKGLAPIARRRFSEGTLKELIDPTMTVEDNEQRFTLNRGPNQDSFNTFTKIAYQCLAETQAKRPPMEVVIEELRNAQNLQGETIVLYKVRLNDIVQATEDFKETYRIGFHAHGMVYKAELDQFESESSSSIEEKNKREEAKKRITVAIKRISSREDDQGEQEFFEELEMCIRYKHPNISSLLGFCDEGHKMIFVYEHACNGSLDAYLGSNDDKTVLTWAQRLRKCIEIARGLNHLHTEMGSKQSIIHGDIRSANILFGKNFEAKIAYFGHSHLHPAQEANTKVYLDPEYGITGKLGTKSDIYSFGVILFEILCGKLAYDLIYNRSDKGLAPIARQRCNDGTIKEMIDRKLLVETDEDGSTVNKGPNQDSLDTFLKVAYQCLGETQTERPTMETVITELQKALNFQERVMRDLQIPLEDIKMATQEFSQENCVGSGRDWKVYKGELSHAKANANANATGRTTIVAKQWIRKYGQHNQFLTELDILYNRKHEDIISLAGYCDEQGETIIVYNHAWNGSLDEHLNNVNLTWTKRLQICINVARGLEFLHGGGVTQKKLVHGNIKSANILLTSDWKAKISNFEFSSIDSLRQHMDHVRDNAYGTLAYLDPEYAKSGYLTDKSDLYSFGVILLEILCGRLVLGEGHVDYSQSLGPLAKRHFEEKNLDKMVFEGIKQQIVPESFSTFKKIAYECLCDYSLQRPKASRVVIQLKKALEYQEDKEIWETKLPRNYREIIDMSKTPGTNSTKKKKDLYKMLSDGIFLQEKKMWYSLSKNGKGNAMISATEFSYENRMSHKWRCIKRSRFHRVAKMMDMRNLKIQIKIKTDILSMDTVYGVHLVFKFCDPIKVSSNPIYVNLKYKRGSKTSHAYFAKHRDDDGWMMIELFRILNQKEVTVCEVSLESFSRYYCGSGAIYIQGVEFQAIENMKHEEMGTQKFPESDANKDQMHQMPKDIEDTFKGSEHNNDGNMIFLQSEVNGKKHLMISATKVLFNSDKMTSFRLKTSSVDSRFQNVMELLAQQVFRIKYKIESEMLSPCTQYACYLVFKLSEKCRELHCPVKVRDLLHRKIKDTKTLYFRSPASFNQHEGNSVQNQRADGWMEVMVWKFKSEDTLANNPIPMNLKLIAYEGTMSGLTICGLDFRSM